MRVVALLASAALAGCTSNYEAVRLSSNGNYPKPTADRTLGVPFTLTKPEFTIKRIEGSDPERFDITVDYVPDSEQRYALRIAPTWLSKIEFSLALGPGGGLTSTSADITDQTVPFLTSAVKLAASVATALPMLSVTQQRPAGEKCLAERGLGAMARCAINESYAQRECSAEAGDAITARLDRALRNDKDDKGAALTTLFARDDAEENCFANAAKKLSEAISLQRTAVASDFDKLAQPLMVPDTNGQLSSSAKLVAQASAIIAKAVTDGDVETARKLIYATDLATKDEGRYLKAALQLDTDPSVADAVKLQGLLKQANLAAGTGAEPILAIANAVKVQKALAGIATMTPGQWRARYIPVLQYELAVAERGALSATEAEDVDIFTGRAATTREKLAAMVNMGPDYARLVKIEAVLDEVPALDASEQQSRIEQYTGYAKQAADIRNELASRITAATASEQEKKKDTVLPVSLPWVSRQCIKDSGQAGWIYTAGAEAADYVIVIRNASGDIVPPKSQEPPPSDGLPFPRCGA